jgi:hypothetical protein
MGSSLYLSGGVQNTSKLVKTFATANSFAVGDVVRYDVASTSFVKAQADSATNSEVVGVVSEASANSFSVVYSGEIDLTSVSTLSGFSGPVLFLTSTVAGGLTANPPSAIGTVVKPLVVRNAATNQYVVTNFLGTQIGGSSTVAIDEIQPVGTIMPFAGSVIPDSWLACDGNSYAISSYPNLYAKLQNSSGDRVPAYGYVVTLGTSNTGWVTANQFVSQPGITAEVIAVNGSTITARVIPNYSSTNKNFVFPNVAFTAAAATATLNTTNTAITISTVAITHFNTPDLRGRFALGLNTSALPTTGDLESDAANNSAISGIYSLGSEGGQESTVVDTAGVLTGTTNSKYTTTSGSNTGLLSNMPPYTVVRYIIKATPYTRAAIIDGIDLPYSNLLVGDLRDGALRPGGSGEDLLFKTNNGTSGTERMRLTNTATTDVALGSVLIGTTSPISTYNNNYRLLEIAQTNGSGGSAVVTRGSTITLESGVTETVGAIIGTRTSHPLIFRTNVNERMRIDANGLVNIGSTTTSTSVTTGGLTLGGGLGVGGAIYATTINATATTPSTTVSTGALTVAGGLGVAGAITTAGLTATTVNATGLSRLARLSVLDGSTDLNSTFSISAKSAQTGGGAVLGYAQLGDNSIYGILGHANAYSFYGLGAIYTSGDITAFSDIRSKENISTIENALDKTLALNGVLYTDKETQQRRTGLIAQDVLSVLPEAVRTNTDGYYALAYGNLVGLLVQSIKELNAKVDALSEKVNSLGGTA